MSRRALHVRVALVCAIALSGASFACSSDTDGDPVVGFPQAGNSGAPGASGSQGSAGAPMNAGSGGGLTFPGAGGAAGNLGTGPKLQTPVNVVITADNAYGFGYGSGSGIVNYFGGVENPKREDIFDCPIGNGPEQYTVPASDANAGDYLYIVSYADTLTTQGVIAEFSREGGAAVYTGSGNWQACATGVDFDPGMGGPTLAQVNEQIAICNAGSGSPDTTSRGWVTSAASERGRVAIGEDNSTTRNNPQPGNEFLIACDINSAARWMWYDWEPNRTEGSPFLWPGGNGNPTKDFLIFRLGAEFVPDPPPR